MCPDFSPAPSPARPPASPPETPPAAHHADPLADPLGSPLGTPPGTQLSRQRWDIYCRVVDNLGDVGVCWRLASALSGCGQEVHLVIDDPSALQWLAAGATAEVQVHRWPGPDELGDVVIEAFGCSLPQAVLQALAKRVAQQQPQAVPMAESRQQPAPAPAPAPAPGTSPTFPTSTAAAPDAAPGTAPATAPAPGDLPIWLNLEHLSAEPYVEASHGLLSPQREGPPKWFFYPGFSRRTGGLLREPDLQARQRSFDRLAWLQSQGLQLRPHEKLVSLFCYANDHLPALLASLADTAQGGGPTLLLATAALPVAVRQMLSAAALKHPALRVHGLPLLSQIDFDHLLWASELNVVRGEDSLVRALWAARPFIWQAYVQRDQAHHAKVLALLDWLDGLDRLDARPEAPEAPAAHVRVHAKPDPARTPAPLNHQQAALQQMASVWRAWNGLPGCPWPGLPGRHDVLGWQTWRDSSLLRRDLMQQPSDLLGRLLAFVASRQQRPEQQTVPAANA